MRASALGMAVLVGLLAACGRDSPSGIKISCSRGSSVQPLTRVELRVQPPTAQGPATALLVYQDPLNHDQTGSLRVDPGDSCTIGMATQVK